MGRRSVGISVATKTSIEIAFTYRDRACRERVKLKPTRDNLAHCRRWRESILHEIATGTFVYRRHFPHSPRAAWFGERIAERLTVGQLLDRWFAAVSTRVNKPLSKAGRMSYESAIRVHWRPRFGRCPIDSLSPDQVREFLAELNISPKTENNLLTPLRQAYGMAFEKELIDKNPLDRVSAATVERDEPDPFTVEEIRAILEACAAPQHRALFQFAFATGLRTSELIALWWGDVDWQKQVVHVRRARVRGEIKTPKTASGRRQVKLYEPAIAALMDQGRHADPPQLPLGSQHAGAGPAGLSQRASSWEGIVFYDPETGQGWPDDAPIRRAWTAALKRAGVRYRCPYQTRHTYASMMLSAGEDPTYIAAQMGHADWGMIRKVYARWIEGVRVDAGHRGAAALSQLALG
jgi:integrase